MTIALMYHDVVSETPSESGFSGSGADSYKVKAIDFEKQVAAISKIQNKNRIIFTFDDGGVGFYKYAAPILEKYGYRGVAFVSTSMIGTEGFMSAEQLRELDNRGHVIASHSHIHQQMHSLDYSVQCSEWKTSVDILSNIIGHKVSIASIPTGYSTKNVIKAAELAGISELYTSKPGGGRSCKSVEVKISGRYVIHDNTSVDDIEKIINYKAYQLVLYIKWSILCIIKKMLGNSYSKLKEIILKSR